MNYNKMSLKLHEENGGMQDLRSIVKIKFS